MSEQNYFEAGRASYDLNALINKEIRYFFVAEKDADVLALSREDITIYLLEDSRKLFNIGEQLRAPFFSSYLGRAVLFSLSRTNPVLFNNYHIRGINPGVCSAYTNLALVARTGELLLSNFVKSAYGLDVGSETLLKLVEALQLFRFYSNPEGEYYHSELAVKRLRLQNADYKLDSHFLQASENSVKEITRAIVNNQPLALLPDFLGKQLVEALGRKQTQASEAGQVSVKAMYKLPGHMISIDVRTNSQGEMIATWADTAGVYSEVKANSAAELVDSFNEIILPQVESAKNKAFDRMNKNARLPDSIKAYFNKYSDRVILDFPSDSQIEELGQLQILPNSCLTISDVVNHDLSLFREIEQVRTTKFINDYIEFMQRPEVLKCLVQNVPAGFQPAADKVSVNDHVLLQMKEVRAAVEYTLDSGGRGGRVPVEITWLHNNLTLILEVILPVIRGNKALLADPQTLDNIAAGLGISAGAAAPPVVWGPGLMPFSGELSESQILNVGQALALAQGADLTEMVDLVRQLPEVEWVRQLPGQQQPALQSEENASLNREKPSNPESQAVGVKPGMIGTIASYFSWESVATAFKGVRPQRTMENYAESFGNVMRANRQLNKNLGEQIGLRLANNEVKNEAGNEVGEEEVNKAAGETINEEVINEETIKEGTVNEDVVKEAEGVKETPGNKVEAEIEKTAKNAEATEEKELSVAKAKKGKRKGTKVRKRTRKAKTKESEQGVLCAAERKKRSANVNCPPKAEKIYKEEQVKVDQELVVAEEDMAGDTAVDTLGQAGLEELGLDGAFTEGLGKESLELLAGEGLAVLPEEVVLETAVGELAAGAMASGIGIAVGALILIIQERELITDLLTDPDKFIDDIYAITLGLEAAGKEIRDNARAHHQRYHQLNGDTHQRYTISELQYIAGGMTAEWFANGLDDFRGKMEKFAEDSYVDPRWQLHGRRRRSPAATGQSGNASATGKAPIEVHLINPHNNQIKKARIEPELLKKLFRGKPSYTLHFVDRRPCHDISPTPGVPGSDSEPRFPIQQPVSELVYQLMMQMRDRFNTGWLGYLESVSVANPWISEPEDVVDDYLTVQQFFWSDIKLQAELRKAGFRCDARELTARQIRLLAEVVGEQVKQAANHFARKAQQINDSIMRALRTSQQQLQDHGIDPSGQRANGVDGPQRILLQRAMDHRVLLGLTDYLQQNNMDIRAYKEEAEAAVAMVGGIEPGPEAGTTTRVAGGNATQPAWLEFKDGQPVVSATALKQLKRVQEHAALKALEPRHQEKQQQLKDDLLTALVDAVGTAGQTYSDFLQGIRLPPDNPADTEPGVVAGANGGKLPDLTRYQYAVDGFAVGEGDIYTQKQAWLHSTQQASANLKKQVQEKVVGLLASIKSDLSAIRGGREPHGDRRGVVNRYYRETLDWARQQRAGFIDGVDRLFQDLIARLDKLAPTILPLTEAIPWPATTDQATVQRVLNGYMGAIRKDLSEGINRYVESLAFGDTGMVEGVRIHAWNPFWSWLTDRMARKVAALQSDGVISRSRLGGVLSIYQQTAVEAYNFYSYQAMELSRKAVKSLQNRYRDVVNYPAEVSWEFGEYLERQEKYHWLDQGGPGSATNEPYAIYGQVVRDQESGEWAREQAQREKEDSDFLNLVKGARQVKISEQWIKDKITHIYYRYAQHIDQQVRAKSFIREQVSQEQALAQSLGLDIAAVNGTESAGNESPANPAAVFFEGELAVWRDRLSELLRHELETLVDYSLTTAYQDFLLGNHNRELGVRGVTAELEARPDARFYAPLDKQRILAQHRAEGIMVRELAALTEQLHSLQVSYKSQGQHSLNDIRAVIDHEKAWASRQLKLLSAHGMTQLCRDWKTNVLELYSESEGISPPLASFDEYLALLAPKSTTSPGPQPPYRLDDRNEKIIPIAPERPAHLQPSRHRRSLGEGEGHSAKSRDTMMADVDPPAATSGASRHRGILSNMRDTLGSMAQGMLSATTGWRWASQSPSGSPAFSQQVPLIEPGATAGELSSSAIRHSRHPGSPDSSSLLLVNYLVGKGTGLPVCENRECSPGGNHSTLPGRERVIGFTPFARPLYKDMVAYLQAVQSTSRAAADGWQDSDYLAMALILGAMERSDIPAAPSQKLVAGFIDQALRSPVVGTGHQRAGDIVARDKRGHLRIQGVGLNDSDHLFYDQSRQLLVTRGNHRALGQCMMAATARQILKAPADHESAAGPGDTLAQQILNTLPEISPGDLAIMHRAIGLQGHPASGSEATIRQMSRQLKGLGAKGGHQQISAPKACRPVIRLLCQDKVNDARQGFIALSPGDQLAGIRALAALPDLAGTDESRDLLAKVVGNMAGLKTRSRKLTPEQLNEAWQLFAYLYDIKQAYVGELINEATLVRHLEQRKPGNGSVGNDDLGLCIKSLLPCKQSIYQRCLTGFEANGHLLPVTAPYHHYDQQLITALIRRHGLLEKEVRANFSRYFGAMDPQLQAELVETLSLGCLLDLKGKRKVAKQTITDVVNKRLSGESAEFNRQVSAPRHELRMLEVLAV